MKRLPRSLDDIRGLRVARWIRESTAGQYDRYGPASRVRDGYLRGAPARTGTVRQVAVLAAFVEAGGSVSHAAARVGICPTTAKRHLADLRARSGLTTEQLIYRGRAEGWLVVPTLEP